MDIVAELPIENGNRIVLLDHQNSYGISNLMRLDQQNDVVWKAELVDQEPYTGMRIEDGIVRAYSYGGWSVDIDIRIGRMVRKTFVK